MQTPEPPANAASCDLADRLHAVTLLPNDRVLYHVSLLREAVEEIRRLRESRPPPPADQKELPL